jgi:DNA (cytosine-5)-methyltransferase 1
MGHANSHPNAGGQVAVDFGISSDAVDRSGENLVAYPIDMRQASRGATMTNNRPAGSSGGAPGTGIGKDGDPSPSLSLSNPPAVVFNVQATYSEGRGPHCQEARITKCLDSHGLNPNCQQGGSLVMAVQESQSGYRLSDTFATLDANYGSRRHNGVVTNLGDKTHALTAEGADASEDGSGRGQPIVAYENIVVRRLTPRECERLQGFPDYHTLVPYRKKPAADGPRYKALGNSIAVPVLRWIGARLLAEPNTESDSEQGGVNG